MPNAVVAAAPAVRSGSMRAWRVAIRPRTLLVALSPVVVGAALGFAHAGAINLLAAALVLGAALLVQIVTNLQNDVGYTLRGGDRSGTRTGLPRASAQGWLSIRQLRTGILVVSLAALLLGVGLALYRGWPVLLIGAASLTAALAYMGGPKPIAYTPFGELTVLVFFGLVAVLGTDWVLSGSIGGLSLTAALAIGGLAAAALAVNNHRDLAHDRSVGRRTFAVVVGPRGSQRLYSVLLLGPFLLVVVMSLEMRAPSLLLPLLLAPLAMRLRRDFLRCAPGIAFNQILFRTFRLEIWFALSLAMGIVCMHGLHALSG
jgi:1,4-dihydroxy-2-naphthoate octaprenyltransferase